MQELVALGHGVKPATRESREVRAGKGGLVLVVFEALCSEGKPCLNIQ